MKFLHKCKGLPILLIAAYLLSACSGVTVQSTQDLAGGGKTLTNEVAFTGTVEALNAEEITINGQIISIDANTVLEPTLQVGDVVKVDAQVLDTGTVLALKVEMVGVDDGITITADPISTSEAIGSADATSPPAIEPPQITSTPAPGNFETEILGIVGDISSTSITVDHVVYHYAPFTEIKGMISIRDTVKLQVIVNADGSFIVREVEKTGGEEINTNHPDNQNNDNEDHGNDDHEDDGDGNGE